MLPALTGRMGRQVLSARGRPNPPLQSNALILATTQGCPRCIAWSGTPESPRAACMNSGRPTTSSRTTSAPSTPPATQFEARFRDVIGVNLNPLFLGEVLRYDAKSQCHTSVRPWNVLGPACRWGWAHSPRSHDYRRHVMVTLFMALDCLTGKVFGQIVPHHRYQEWLRLLERIDQFVPRNRPCIWCWTITPCANPRRSRSGWRNIRALCCILPQRVRRGLPGRRLLPGLEPEHGP